MLFEMEKTYLFPINFIITNKRYKKISIPLITNFKFLSEKRKIMQIFFQ